MDYTEITDAALAYSDRQDSGTIAKLNIFLKVVEARLNRYLTTQKMSLTVSLPGVVAQTEYALPSDFLSFRNVRISSTTTPELGYVLAYATPAQIENYIILGSNTAWYTHVNGKIKIYKTIDATEQLDITYYQKIPPLTSVNTTNWMSDNNPDCYIFGLLAEINAFIKDATAAQLWDQRFTESLSNISDQDAKSTWSGPTLRTRII